MKKWLIYTSLLGYFVIGAFTVMDFLEKRQYSNLKRLWCDAFFLIPIYLFIVLAAFGIEKYFCFIPVLRYTFYIFLILIVYILGVLMLKRLFALKDEVSGTALVAKKLKRR